MRQKWGFEPALRTLAAFLVIGSVYGFTIALPRYVRQHKNAPHKELRDFRVDADENYLALTSLAAQPGSDVRVAQYLSDARGVLVQSQTTLATKLKQPRKELSNATAGELNKDLATETQLLANYDARYAVFQIALSYNPADNLGIDLNKNTAVLITRANTAKDALNTLASTGRWLLNPKANNAVQSDSDYFSLSSDTLQALQNSSTCFANFAQELSDKDFSDAPQTLQLCIDRYTALRQQLTATVVAPLKSDDAKAVTNSLQDVIKQLDGSISA